MGLQLEGQFAGNGESLFSIFLKIGHSKATGLLTLEWDKFKKQIGFKKGEPVLIKSNWPQESFANFLTKEGYSAAKVKEQMSEWEAQNPRPDLNAWLVGRGFVSGEDLVKLHSKYFLFRLFNLLWQGQGKFSFKELNADYDFGGQPQTLNEPFLKTFLDRIIAEEKDQFFTGLLKPFSGKTPKFETKQFPLPINATLLREWNQVIQKLPHAETCRAITAKLLSVATVLQEVSWMLVESIALVTLDELNELSAKYSGMKQHEILGVESDAPIEKCKEIYHELIRKYHPDKIFDPILKKSAESVFAFINDAYTTMTDPFKRAEYQAAIELEKIGGVEVLQKRVEAEMMIPQAQQSLRRRHFRQALEAFEEIQKVMPDDGEVLADKTYAEMMWIVETKQNLKAKISKLRQSFDSAIALRPRYAPVYHYRGLLFKYDGQLEKALEDFDTAISIDSNLVEAQSEARLIRMRSGKQKA